uniref:Tudor domain-containing protein n=1 Tax=Chrysotila carterae TaxID=13221 RepID=A0A7S4BF54_CHRCT|mmetsp:Transcript_37760/g.79416  ORF Transcript_37760/g.79416 Transcript_37760/m.79416 type:complete len:355 (+) Transcript_37760:210-1274(+)
MPPKGKGNPVAAKAADKTFGMKNKSKSKQAAMIIKQAQGGQAVDAQMNKKKQDEQKRAQAMALDALLFQEAVKKPKKKEVKVEKKVEEVVEVEPTELEEKIEWQRARIKSRTPVTLERLQAWLQAKVDAKASAQSGKLKNAKGELEKGKRVHGLTGKDLFSVDPNLFVDDAEAVGDGLDERVGTDDEESEEEGEDGSDNGKPNGTANGTANGGHASSSAAARRAARVDLVIGERVKAKYLGGKFWYEGVVLDVHADGTAKLEYEDGDVEEKVSRDLIQLLDREPAPKPFAVPKPAAAAAAAAAAPAAAPAPAPAQAQAPAAAASASAAADTPVALEDVDESLFLNEELPDDDDV